MFLIPGAIRGCAAPGSGRGGRADGHDLRKVRAAGRACGGGGASRRRPRAGRQRGAGRVRPLQGALRQGGAARAEGATHTATHGRAERPRFAAAGEFLVVIIQRALYWR